MKNLIGSFYMPTGLQKLQERTPLSSDEAPLHEDPSAAPHAIVVFRRSYRFGEVRSDILKPNGGGLARGNANGSRK
jgi:hypothetical protein